ncbi:alternate-type signal peptide domain-containing protein [Cellulomonas denverensis]|uniref:alternate-type signal peptide domain-containing protein n=1 Tax=Cellulomonas denverensis TaxID=264297 RepID=UPI0035EF7760
MTTPRTTSRHSALKGTVAATAGIAVLLAGAGTFALWNQQGAIGSGSTGTGALTAEFDPQTRWRDATDGAGNPIEDITAFRMVPGDTLVGTTGVSVTATGENLLVDTGLHYAEGALQADVTAEVTLTDGEGEPVTRLEGSNTGTRHELTATITLAFDADAAASMSEPIDLSAISVDLRQVLN